MKTPTDGGPASSSLLEPESSPRRDGPSLQRPARLTLSPSECCLSAACRTCSGQKYQSHFTEVSPALAPTHTHTGLETCPADCAEVVRRDRAQGSSQLPPPPLGLVQASTQLQAPHVTEKPGLAPPCPESGRASHFCCGAPTLPLLDERPPRLSILFTSFPIKASICTPRNYLSLGRRQRAAWLDPGHRVWSLWVPVRSESGYPPARAPGCPGQSPRAHGSHPG